MLRRVYGVDEALAAFESRDTGFGDEAPLTDGGGIYSELMTAERFADKVIADVESGGDGFVRRLTEALDGVAIDDLEVSVDVVKAAKRQIDPSSVTALEKAAERVWEFQKRGLPMSWRDDGKGYGEVVHPVNSVGCCVPGGTAPLASTVVMTAVPAKVAGVPKVYVATPPESNGLPHPAVLAACDISGVDRVFRVGGAQAVAAMAVGTETIPKVDMICGPGSIWVTRAKQRVYGKVGIDGIYGPTETMVIVDDTSAPEFAAADLLAQAEHDPLAAPVLVSMSTHAANAVEVALEDQLRGLPRATVAGAALRGRGMAIIVSSVKEALKVAEAFAPEHLCLAFEGAEDVIGEVRNAGGIFVGERSGEVMADYVAGPSHVMPTGGSARWASALSVRDFVRVTPFLDMDEETFLELSGHAANLATLEELDGHANAASIRRRAILGE